MLAAENWCIKVNERVYGPYTSEQLRKFAHEGRFSRTSLVSPAGGREWREAGQDTSFATFFGLPAGSASDGAGAKAFGRDRPKANVVARRSHKKVAEQFSVQSKPLASNAAESANFIVIFEVGGVAGNRIERVLSSMGPTFRLAENVWTVNCGFTAIGLRNCIAPFLHPSESVFVVDATNGRTCWQNYAPEPHAKISAAYMNVKN